MQHPARTLLFAVGTIQLASAVALFFQWPPVTALWPFPGTTPLTFIFVASILAAAGASTLWAVASQQRAALAGIAIDYIFILVPGAIYTWQLASGTGGEGLGLYVVASLLGVLFGVWLLFYSLRAPLDQSVPVPAPVRWAFVIFVVALLIVSVLLIRQVPNILPWSVTPELSVLIGWMFFGALTYFVYGLARPSWANAAGQLVGFLAYDIVLIVPFLQRLPTVAPELRLSLWVYTAVVVFSGLLACYYLFVHAPTRLLAEPVARHA